MLNPNFGSFFFLSSDIRLTPEKKKECYVINLSNSHGLVLDAVTTFISFLLVIDVFDFDIGILRIGWNYRTKIGPWNSKDVGYEVQVSPGFVHGILLNLFLAILSTILVPWNELGLEYSFIAQCKIFIYLFFLILLWSEELFVYIFFLWTAHN